MNQGLRPDLRIAAALRRRHNTRREAHTYVPGAARLKRDGSTKDTGEFSPSSSSSALPGTEKAPEQSGKADAS